MKALQVSCPDATFKRYVGTDYCKAFYGELLLRSTNYLRMKNRLLISLIFFCLFLQAQESKFSIDKLLPAPVAGSFSMEGYWIWGASVVETEGMFHMYATRAPMSYKFHPGRMIADEFVHAVSDKPEGPYRFSDIALERRGMQYWNGCSTYDPQVIRHSATMDGSGFNGKEARNLVIPLSEKCLSSGAQTTTKQEALRHIRIFYAERRNKETRVLEDSVKKYTTLLNEKGETVE